MTNESDQFEIIISDNHSSDQTLNIINNFDDKRIMCVQPTAKISPFENYWFTYSHATGNYVFFVGGDDYFEPRIIDNIINDLKDNRVFIGEMNSFSDRTKKSKYVRNKKEWLEKHLFNGKDFFSNYLSQINHDEIMLSFIPRHFLETPRKLIGISNEHLYPWIAFTIFSDQNIANNVGYISKIVFHKRYDKKHSVGNYTKDMYAGLFSNFLFVSCVGSIYNSFVVFSVSKSWMKLAKLLFLNRSHERPTNLKGGFMGQGKLGAKSWSFGPVITLLLSPFLDTYRISKYFYKLFIDKTLRWL